MIIGLTGYFAAGKSEASRIFKENNFFETGVFESEHVAVMLCSETAGFTQAKQILESIMTCFDINFSLVRSDFPWLISGRAAEVHFNGEKIGCFGEVHPRLISKRGIIVPISYLELNFDKISKIIQNKS